MIEEREWKGNRELGIFGKEDDRRLEESATWFWVLLRELFEELKNVVVVLNAIFL